jgi:hypothetical protein
MRGVNLAAWGVVVVFFVIPVLITWMMGRRKHRHGIWWGLILGWVGVLLLALNWPRRRN